MTKNKNGFSEFLVHKNHMIATQILTPSATGKKLVVPPTSSGGHLGFSAKWPTLSTKFRWHTPLSLKVSLVTSKVKMPTNLGVRFQMFPLHEKCLKSTENV